MDPDTFDLNSVESIFVEDEAYENINAPKWIDLGAPDEPVADDESWFCNPDCQHPKTAEDFFRSTTNSKVKLPRSATISEFLPFKNRDSRDAKLKMREIDTSRKFYGDSENQNPNLVTPPLQNKTKVKQAAIKVTKPRTERKELDESSSSLLQHDKKPQLKSTFSARNLFAGREILNQITEFCGELKKLARKGPKKGPPSDETYGRVLGNLKDSVRNRESMPLLEVTKGNCNF